MTEAHEPTYTKLKQDQIARLTRMMDFRLEQIAPGIVRWRSDEDNDQKLADEVGGPVSGVKNFREKVYGKLLKPVEAAPMDASLRLDQQAAVLDSHAAAINAIIRDLGGTAGAALDHMLVAGRDGTIV